jgi:hypothetical protein
MYYVIMIIEVKIKRLVVHTHLALSHLLKFLTGLSLYDLQILGARQVSRFGRNIEVLDVPEGAAGTISGAIRTTLKLLLGSKPNPVHMILLRSTWCIHQLCFTICDQEHVKSTALRRYREKALSYTGDALRCQIALEVYQLCGSSLNMSTGS